MLRLLDIVIWMISNVYNMHDGALVYIMHGWQSIWDITMTAYCALVVVFRSSWLTELVLSKVIFLCKFRSDARCICIQLLCIYRIRTIFRISYLYLRVE